MKQLIITLTIVMFPTIAMAQSGRETVAYVNPDCSCTNYLLSQKIIMPSDTACVELQVNTNGKYGLNKIHSTMKADTFVKMYKLTIIFNVLEPQKT